MRNIPFHSIVLQEQKRSTMDDSSARGITKLVNAPMPGRDSITAANLAAASSVMVDFSEASMVVTHASKKNDGEFHLGGLSAGHTPLGRFHFHSEKEAKLSEDETSLSLWSALVACDGLGNSGPSMTSTLTAPLAHSQVPAAPLLSSSENQPLKLPPPIQFPSIASDGSASPSGPRTRMIPASCTPSIRHPDAPDSNGNIHHKRPLATRHDRQSVLPRQRNEDAEGDSMNGSTYHEGDALASITTRNFEFSVENLDQFDKQAANEESKAQGISSPTHRTSQELEKTPGKKSEQELAQEAHERAHAAAHIAAQDREMKMKARGELHGQVARRRSSTIHPHRRMSRMSVSGDELPNDLRFPQERQSVSASFYTKTPSLEEDISPMTQEPHAPVCLNEAMVAFRGIGNPHQETHKGKTPLLSSNVPACPVMRAGRTSENGLNPSNAKNRNDNVRAAMCTMSATGTNEGVTVVHRMPPTPPPPPASMASPAPGVSSAAISGRRTSRMSVASLEDDFQFKAGRNDNVRAAMCAMSATGTAEGVTVVRRMPPTPPASMASPAPGVISAAMTGRRTSRKPVASLEDDFQVKADRNDDVRAAMCSISATGTTEAVTVVRRMPPTPPSPPGSTASSAPRIQGATLMDRRTSRKSVASLEADCQVKADRNDSVRAAMSAMSTTGTTEGATVVRRMPPYQAPPPASMASPAPSTNGASMMEHCTARKSVASLEADFQVNADRNDSVRATMSAMSTTGTTEGATVVRRMPPYQAPPPASMASPAPSINGAPMMGRHTARKSVASLEADCQVKADRNDNVRAAMSANCADVASEGVSVVHRMPPTAYHPHASLTSPAPSIDSATMMGRRTARKSVARLEDDSRVKANRNDNARSAMSANGGTGVAEGVSVVRRMPPSPPPPPATMASPAPNLDSATMIGRKSVTSLEDDFQVKTKARNNLRSSRVEDGVEPWVVTARQPLSVFSSTSTMSTTSKTGSVMGMAPKPPSLRSTVSSAESVSSDIDFDSKTRPSVFASFASRPSSLRSSTSTASTTASVMGMALKHPSLSSLVSLADSVSSGIELDAETRYAIISSSTARRSIQEECQTRRSEGDATTSFDLANLFRKSSFDSDSVADPKTFEGNHAAPNDLSRGRSTFRPCDEKSEYRAIRASSMSAMVRPAFDEKEAESAYRTNRCSSESVMVRPPFDEKEAEYISRSSAYIVARTPPGPSQGLRLAAATWQESEVDGQDGVASLPHSKIFDMSCGEEVDHEVPSQVIPDVEVQAGVPVILPGTSL
jgi:hypothetical protein